MSWGLLLSAAVAVTLPGCGSPQASPPVASQMPPAADTVWLRVSSTSGSLTILGGSIVEVEGSGRLEFVDGRRTIRLPRDARAVSADGQPVAEGPHAGPEVRIIDEAGTWAWRLRPVESLPSGAGTRIRDVSGGTASVSSDETLRFYLRVEADGTTEFFHPETPGPEPGSVSPAARRISLVLDRYADYGFSGVVVADVPGSPEPLIAAAGRRHPEGSGLPMDASTIFELGSLTKQLTAAAVLELEDRGLLSTDHTLGRWRPELPPELADITLHQLLIHVSGLPEDVDVRGDDTDAVWRTLSEVRLEFAPGDEWSYSNLGYTVLAAIVEESVPDGYRGLVEELVRRAGVEDLGFPERHPEWERRFAIGGSGPLGTGRSTERWPIEPSGWDRRLGASGAVATIPALYDWFRALRGGRVLSPAATARMFEERPPEIAYGWFYMRNGEEPPRIAHGGDTKGFQTYLTYETATDRILALGINDRRGWRAPLLRALEAIVEDDTLPELPPSVSADARRLSALGGRYDLPGGSSLHADVVDGRLRLAAEGQEAIAMLTGSDATLADSLAAISRRTGEFLSSLVRGDSAAVDTALAPSGRSDSFWRVWDHLTAGHPNSPRAFRVLGTIPDRAGRIVSFSRVEFDAGEETLRLVWRPHLDGWGTGGDLPSRDFWFAGEGRFVSFDPSRRGWVELRLQGAADAPMLVDENGRRAIRAAGDS